MMKNFLTKTSQYFSFNSFLHSDPSFRNPQYGIFEFYIRARNWSIETQIYARMIVRIEISIRLTSSNSEAHQTGYGPSLFATSSAANADPNADPNADFGVAVAPSDA